MTDRTLPLGVLDLSKRHGTPSGAALTSMIATARAAEAAGYARFWIAEHHVPGTSHASPEIVAGVIAARTDRMRIGSGGVLLRYYSPLKVAENFLTLEALFPGRIDLGVAQGPGVVDNAVGESLVDGNTWELRPEVFDRKVFRLATLLSIAGGEGLPRVHAQPDDVVAPPLWVLGSGRRSLELALRLHRPYALAAFTAGAGLTALPLAHEYRRHASGPDARLILTVSVTVAPTDVEAAADDAAKRTAGYLAGNVVGDSASVTARLREIREDTHSDELLLTSFGTPPDRWQRQIEEIARTWREQEAD